MKTIRYFVRWFYWHFAGKKPYSVTLVCQHKHRTRKWLTWDRAHQEYQWADHPLCPACLEEATVHAK